MSVGSDALGLGASALTKATSVSSKQRRVRIAAPQGGSVPQNTQLTNGTTQTSGTDRIFYQLNSDYAWLSAVLANGSPASGSGALTKPGNGVTIRLTLEQGGTSEPAIISFPSSTLAAVSTGGKTGHIIGDGEIIVSSPVYKVSLLKNSYQAIRFYKTVTSGQKWPVTWGYGNYNILSGSYPPSGSPWTTDQVNGTTIKDGSDLTYTGSAAGGPVAGSSTYWAPAFIVGEQITPAVTSLVAGDSVSAGFGDALGRGYIVRGLEQAGMIGQYLNCGVPASTTANLTTSNVIAKRAADYVDYVLLHTISNDFATSAITTLAAAQAAILSVCQNYTRAANKIIIATCLPRCATTDSGATYTGQTKPSWEALRLQYNNWLRDKTSNGAMAYLNANIKTGYIAAIMDPCIQVERNWDGTTATNITLDSNGQQATGNGGYFLAGGSTDCTHPNAALAAVTAAAVPVSLLTI